MYRLPQMFGLGLLTFALLVSAGVGQDKKSKSKKPADTGTIEIIESKDGKFRFSVRDAEGKYLGGSAVGHATEKETKEVVEHLKTVLSTATYVHKKSEATTKKAKDDKKEKSDK